MPRSLEDARTKFTILTTAPADPQAPTAAELNAGIQASCRLLASDFTWGATDSDKIQQKDMCTEGNANALGASNFSAGFTPFRYYDATTGASATTEGDEVFQALKEKGTELYGYARKSAKKATEIWATGDEIYLGGKFVTDEPQPPSDQGGWQRWRVPAEMQDAYTWIEVVAATP